MHEVQIFPKIFLQGLIYVEGMSMNGIKIPILQYFLKEEDFMVKFVIFTKDKRRIIPLQTAIYIGGLRKNADLI